MNELQSFDFEGNKIRTVTINNKPYFIGKDVAQTLGYANTRDALSKHVDDEDKITVAIHDGNKGNPNQTVVTESGIYSLIFGSRLDSAKRFKHWVTSEVLPTIRKTGTYQQKPLTAIQQIKLANTAVVELDERVTDLEDNQSLSPGEYNYISRRVNGAVAEYVSVNHLQLNKKQRSKLFSDINSGVNEVTGIKTRSQLRKKDFDVATEFIANWMPSTATKIVIKQLGSEVEGQLEFNY